MAAQVMWPFATRRAICNCLYGVPLLFSDDLAAAFARAVNDWIAREWLDADPRLRASIVVAPPRWVAASTGRSTRPPAAMACPSASMPAQCAQSVLTSLVLEGVFEQFPTLKVVIVEAGFAWAPALTWRLDAQWAVLRAELPRVKRPPSEYIRSQVWFTTQPMEEPDPREHLLDTMEWMGWDRLLVATDYPHWDFTIPPRRCRCG